MTRILKGAPVAGALTNKIKRDILDLSTYDIKPTLAIVRVGKRHESIAYEKGVMKFCGAVGAAVRSVELPEDIEKSAFYAKLQDLNTDSKIHGIQLCRPLPGHLGGDEAWQMLSPAKDVNGCTEQSLGGVFTNKQFGFTPCTAQAVMELLQYYGIPCTGRRAVVIGRSLVVGRPLAMLLLHENASVTICHSATSDLPSIAREADMLFCCTGQMESIGKEYLREGQVVIDIGVSYNPQKHGLCGDVKFDEAEKIVAALTPVPGGIGTITSSVLISHVVEAAKKGVH